MASRPPKAVLVQVRMEADLKARLDAESERTGAPISEIIRRAIEKSLSSAVETDRRHYT